MADYNLGPYRIKPKGEFKSTEKYKFLDLITYNGSSYICINYETLDNDGVIGILPEGESNSELYFQCIGKKGDKGDMADSYESFLELKDSNWDYSKSDKVIIPKNLAVSSLNITNVYDGCVGIVITTNGALQLPDNSDYSYDFYFVDTMPGQYYIYSFIYSKSIIDGTYKFIWNRSIIDGN